TGTCPAQSRTYPYDLNLINDNVLDPLGIEVDDSGNVYVLGRFPTFNWSKEYQISQTTKVYAPQTVYTSAFYLYKINKKGEIQWAHSLTNENQTLDDVASPASFSINQFSGKVYLVLSALDNIYLDENKINTMIDNSKFVQKKMMICFNSDGSYNKTIFSPGFLTKPLFSSLNLGVYKASKISDFYPWDDSISFYSFDAQKDSILGYKYSNSDRLLYFDKQKQAYITDLLAEYNTNLIKTKNNQYNHTHLGSIVSKNDVIEYKMDKQGSHYFYYYNKDPNTNNNEKLYYLLKLDANLNRKWVHSISSRALFQVDSLGNPWLDAASGSVYNVQGPSNQKYPVLYNNPSDHYLVMLDNETGNITSSKIVPTNMIQQTYLPGLFKIDDKNNFWIAGLMYNEMEFGNFKLSMNCPSNYLPLQHYIARAKEGWGQDRKNLSIESLQEYQPLSLFPNPANQYIQINILKGNSIESIEIFDMLGMKVPVAIDPSENRINVQDIACGLYTVRVKMNNQYYITKITKI
ncbi:MAG: T9SS type A sorting domain-containing protein, partial [Bacteroidetes bacterium]|nr:T9SS type A sorting domain-containing protein [Bacteroidota bacterium]